jgi:hypothetical protein
LPDEIERWWSRDKTKPTLRVAGPVAAVNGATTAAGVTGWLAHVPSATLKVILVVGLCSQVLTFAGLALLYWLQRREQRAFWTGESGRLLLELTKETRAGGRVIAPPVEIDYSGVAKDEENIADEQGEADEPPSRAAQ